MDGEKVDWIESAATLNHPIVSARKRIDNQWGFQCVCGNNDLMTHQEISTYSNPTAQPSSKELTDIVKDLKPDTPRFKMAVA